ncbi:hypothetical protein DE146DRAFT_749811 [Phaeosphaeria sp. MPI-PUGE-AT-0046c]|nr:hypothetical protein DE146DRAFT_749811 [Phaeosphaeria sp. MPI-PUGE-AT-0046c]
MLLLMRRWAVLVLLVILIVVLSATTASGTYTESPPLLRYDSNHSSTSGSESAKFVTLSISERASDDDVVWFKAVCKGQKIFQALTSNIDTAERYLTPITSIWDGPLVNELKAWGYNDISSMKDHACHFHLLETAFTALGIDYKSIGEGGPNRCFGIEHQNGPTVIKDGQGKVPPPWKQFYTGPNGLRYQATRAHATLGVNTVNGVLYFIDRNAPATAAREYWPNRANNPPRAEELPLLSASSDYAWGFWNQANPVVGATNIQKIMSLDIINSETLVWIDRALRSIEQPHGQPKITKPQVWPGTTFILNGDSEALALLGSPNGLGAGFFLAQHKAQLGNKVISKITVWTASETDLPNLLFWVADELEPDPEDEDPEDPLPDILSKHIVERQVVGWSADKKHIIREHIFRARL